MKIKYSFPFPDLSSAFTDKITPTKVRETNQQVSKVEPKVERKEVAVYRPVMSSATNFLPSTSFNHPQPKIEATDRRQIEALNEDKSHTTKEALDDFRRMHLNENRKKEQDNMEQYWN